MGIFRKGKAEIGIFYDGDTAVVVDGNTEERVPREDAKEMESFLLSKKWTQTGGGKKKEVPIKGFEMPKLKGSGRFTYDGDKAIEPTPHKSSKVSFVERLKQAQSKGRSSAAGRPLKEKATEDESLVLAAAKQAQERDAAYMPSVRSVRALVGLTKPRFDAAAIRLATKGKVHLRHEPKPLPGKRDDVITHEALFFDMIRPSEG